MYANAVGNSQPFTPRYYCPLSARWAEREEDLWCAVDAVAVPVTRLPPATLSCFDATWTVDLLRSDACIWCYTRPGCGECVLYAALEIGTEELRTVAGLVQQRFPVALAHKFSAGWSDDGHLVFKIPVILWLLPSVVEGNDIEHCEFELKPLGGKGQVHGNVSERWLRIESHAAPGTVSLFGHAFTPIYDLWRRKLLVDSGFGFPLGNLAGDPRFQTAAVLHEPERVSEQFDRVAFQHVLAAWCRRRKRVVGLPERLPVLGRSAFQTRIEALRVADWLEGAEAVAPAAKNSVPQPTAQPPLTNPSASVASSAGLATGLPPNGKLPIVIGQRSAKVAGGGLAPSLVPELMKGAASGELERETAQAQVAKQGRAVDSLGGPTVLAEPRGNVNWARDKVKGLFSSAGHESPRHGALGAFLGAAFGVICSATMVIGIFWALFPETGGGSSMASWQRAGVVPANNLPTAKDAELVKQLSAKFSAELQSKLKEFREQWTKDFKALEQLLPPGFDGPYQPRTHNGDKPQSDKANAGLKFVQVFEENRKCEQCAPAYPGGKGLLLVFGNAGKIAQDLAAGLKSVRGLDVSTEHVPEFPCKEHPFVVLLAPPKP